MKNNERMDELGALARKFGAPYVLLPDTHVCHMPAKSPHRLSERAADYHFPTQSRALCDQTIKGYLYLDRGRHRVTFCGECQALADDVYSRIADAEDEAA